MKENSKRVKMPKPRKPSHPNMPALEWISDVSGRAARATAVGSRRNTFGPLHVLPVVEPFVGPESFESSGAHFTEDYSLIPFGLDGPVFLK